MITPAGAMFAQMIAWNRDHPTRFLSIYRDSVANKDQFMKPAAEGGEREKYLRLGLGDVEQIFDVYRASAPNGLNVKGIVYFHKQMFKGKSLTDFDTSMINWGFAKGSTLETYKSYLLEPAKPYEPVTDEGKAYLELMKKQFGITEDPEADGVDTPFGKRPKRPGDVVVEGDMSALMEYLVQLDAKFTNLSGTIIDKLDALED